MTFDAGDVVVVPFPFTDQAASKRRPALILSRHHEFGATAGHSVMAMITSAKGSHWPFDVIVTDRDTAGLAAPCVVRMKLFTLDHRFIERQVGVLGAADRAAVAAALSAILMVPPGAGLPRQEETC